jgi:hypothetical protein
MAEQIDLPCVIFLLDHFPAGSLSCCIIILLASLSCRNIGLLHLHHLSGRIDRAGFTD